MDFEDWLKNYTNCENIETDIFSYNDMKNCAEAHKPRWISVSESLPENNGRYPVLVTGYIHWTTEYFYGAFPHLVTHWLDIPELPEGE